MVDLHTETLSNSKALEFSLYNALTIIIAITEFRLSSMPLIICGRSFKLYSFQEEGAPLFFLLLLIIATVVIVVLLFFFFLLLSFFLDHT